MNTDVAPCLCQQVCHGIDVESSHARNYFLMPLSQHKFITTLSQDNKACVLMITGGGCYFISLSPENKRQNSKDNGIICHENMTCFLELLGWLWRTQEICIITWFQPSSSLSWLSGGIHNWAAQLHVLHWSARSLKCTRLWSCSRDGRHLTRRGLSWCYLEEKATTQKPRRNFCQC